MSEWGVALIAAGSAIAGGAITGWFTRSAGRRQAEAARHAGDRQADALLETVRMTLDEQRVTRVLDQRRQTCVRFLEMAEAARLGRSSGDGRAEDRSGLWQALGAVLLECPREVGRAAQALFDGLRGHRTADELDELRRAFLEAARHALQQPEGPR